MREIKFRYYSHKSKEVRSWDDLQKLHVHTVFNMMQPECKIMQFTGLKDKNEVEIYEGDVVMCYPNDIRTSYMKVVEWSKDRAELGITGSSSGLILCEGAKEYIEVIGNIYENPELLVVK